MRALLTLREAEISSLVARGLRSKQIARLLNVAPRTIDFHIGHVLRKTGAANRRELQRRVLALPLSRRVVARLYANNELRDAAE
jgi:DNA-binding CsgD family transcriptional regulator